MPHRLYPTRLASRQRARLVVVASLVGGLLVTGCGGNTPGQTPTTRSGARTTASRAGGSGSNASHGGSGPLAYAECMRAHGVPNFPDPKPGGGFDMSGIDPTSPAFRAAQSTCQKRESGAVGGPLIPGAQTHPSPQTLAKLRRIAVCMRAHGVPQFPDPRTSIPSNISPGEYQEITNFDGVILLLPTTLNLQAPAYKQALATCGAPPLGLPH